VDHQGLRKKLALTLPVPLSGSLTQGISGKPQSDGRCPSFGCGYQKLNQKISHFFLSTLYHGWFFWQTFHSYLQVKQYFSGEVIGKQP
jgi:hypothetical protein